MKRIALVLGACLATYCLQAAEPIFVEAESFSEHGGWSLDTQFVVGMGSPYLLAHGIGKPVADAKTKITIPAAATYKVWVRTKDWVGPWNAPGAPGRFQIFFDHTALPTEFGTKGAEWHWQEGAEIRLPKGEVTIGLRDLTGFDGRCDAIILSSDKNYHPPEGAALAQARKKWLNLPDGPENAGDFDLVVVGGGYSGMGAAISAARQSLKVAFIQDRFVLGGNGSSEIRVWANGGTMRGKYPHVGEIVEEFADHAKDSPGLAEDYGDQLKEAICRREKTMSLFLGHFMQEAELDSEGKIVSITALDVRTGRHRKFKGKFFVDCSGHGELGAQAKAAYRMSPKGRMGMSNMWFLQDETSPQDWPSTPWALPLEMGDFPSPRKSKSELEGKPFLKAEWFWESGFDKDPIFGAEMIRDWNLRAAYGAFTALKVGSEKEKYRNAALKWVAYIGGPRESRLLTGDVILSREHIVGGEQFPDGVVPTTWDIDLHYPKEQYAKKFPENPFISRAEFGAGVDRKDGYLVPYRSFYSTNVPNLFMAGRCISVTHEALGTIRVMRTCGMMGEVVGKAAYICVSKGTTPRGVYEKHLPLLIDLISQPGAMRRDTLAGNLYRDENVGKVAPYHNKTIDLGGQAAPASHESTGIQPKTLGGIVVDDANAIFIGTWGKGKDLMPYVGSGYRYANPESKNAQVKFPFTVQKAGQYELRLAWVPHENRATKAPCSIEKNGASMLKIKLNQQTKPADKDGFHSLGFFEFEPGVTNAVVLSTAGADGFVHADCLQVVEAKR